MGSGTVASRSRQWLGRTSCLLPVPTPCLPSAVHQGPPPTGLAGSLLSERLTVASLRSLCLAVRRAERPVVQLTAQPSPLLRYQPSKAQRTFSRGKPLRVERGRESRNSGKNHQLSCQGLSVISGLSIPKLQYSSRDEHLNSHTCAHHLNMPNLSAGGWSSNSPEPQPSSPHSDHPQTPAPCSQPQSA